MLFKDSVIIQHIFNIHIINIRGEEIQYKCIFMISGGTLIEYRLFLKIKWRYYHMTLKWFCMRDKMERFSSTSLLNVIIFLPKFVQCFKFCIVFLVIILTFNMYCLHVFKFLIILIWMHKYRSKTQTIITKCYISNQSCFYFTFLVWYQSFTCYFLDLNSEWQN